MWIPPGESYYRYNWDVSALSPGYRDIHVIAYNNLGQYTDVVRVVRIKPSLTVTSVDFTDGHTLWYRFRTPEEEITGPAMGIWRRPEASRLHGWRIHAL